MYDAVVDLYCYTGTTVLRNIPDIHDQETLDTFEAVMTAQRSDEPLPQGNFDVSHYQAIHHHLFQDVYEWAGAFRTVRISKGMSAFCYPEYIEPEMKTLFSDLEQQNFLRGLSPDAFAVDASHFLTMLNAIHPFREGNGRTQTSFLLLLAENAGHPLDMDKLVPKDFLDAIIASFEKDETMLQTEIKKMITEPPYNPNIDKNNAE